jgi:hypothetical protein
MVVQDVLYLALFGVALKREAGNVARFIGSGSLSLHKVHHALLTHGERHTPLGGRQAKEHWPQPVVSTSRDPRLRGCLYNP